MTRHQLTSLQKAVIAKTKELCGLFPVVAWNSLPKESQAKVFNGVYTTLLIQERTVGEILSFCEPHMDEMWAATVVGIVLQCDFRRAKEELAALKAPKPTVIK